MCPTSDTARRSWPGSSSAPGVANLDAAALRAFCEGRIAHQKIPRYVHVVDAFPMTVTGKVRKVEMRQISIEQLGLHAVASIHTA